MSPGVALIASVAIAGKSLLPVDAGALTAALRPAGRPVVVHLWASWCRPCVAEWPSLGAWVRAAERRVSFVSICLDDGSRAKAVVRLVSRLPGRALRASTADAFASLRGLDPAWQGDLPATFVIDVEGRLTAAERGFTNLQSLTSAVDRVLNHKQGED